MTAVLAVLAGTVIFLQLIHWPDLTWLVGLSGAEQPLQDLYFSILFFPCEFPPLCVFNLRKSTRQWRNNYFSLQQNQIEICYIQELKFWENTNYNYWRKYINVKNSVLCHRDHTLSCWLRGWSEGWDTLRGVLIASKGTFQQWF